MTPTEALSAAALVLRYDVGTNSAEELADQLDALALESLLARTLRCACEEVELEQIIAGQVHIRMTLSELALVTKYSRDGFQVFNGIRTVWAPK